MRASRAIPPRRHRRIRTSFALAAAAEEASVKRLVYFFGNGKANGTREMKSVLGGKGANLAEMTNLGVPVPPGLTIACEVSVSYLRDGTYPAALRDEVAKNLDRLERSPGNGAGHSNRPLV